MIRMYGFWRSAAAFRVRIALNLKRLAYEEIMIDLDAGEQNRPEYRAVNPQEVVPSVIIDDAPPLYESIAIIEYLDEIYRDPPLLPADARGRARVRSLGLIYAADHHPLIVPRIRRYLAETVGLDEAGRTAWIRHWFAEGLRIGEARLAAEAETGAFCHGDAPSLADLCLMSQAMGARGFGIDLAIWPVTARIVAACLARDEFARALPLRQKGAPAAH